MVENGSISRAGKGATLPQDKIVVEGSQFDDLENDGIVKDESIATDEKMTGDDSLEIKLKLETEESLRKLEIERLAEENLRGMDAFGYDNFLLKEKQRELEKLPMEQAEKERLAEEQRQREAEKAASEADRAQARAETEKRRGMLQELMKKTARSVDDVWYIEPSEFKGEDMVNLSALIQGKLPGGLLMAEKTARMKAGTQERTLKRFLLSQKHIVYAEPLDVQAGSTVTVFYNPANTVLNGNGSHVNATVKVPLDAYMMDFVFSEKEDGEVFYNREGMDYHIPVSGGIAKEPSMHIAAVYSLKKVAASRLLVLVTATGHCAVRETA
ncbi:hypothetical protein NC653_026837 [Populus alba x Populus x berolinensis]|uniref:starch synthase n=1 Tax=Populus alba x Populus x berolinensis TaxID=444605 RepID=A0AAD6M495_9ROSI|nr:hypothetical protein NC653_026832 [Populus alba x Populus x berolinensis]KAJ6978535.1 hypothetical protein NC653_026837 [Populus alba x Populus x berolinensis]